MVPAAPGRFSTTTLWPSVRVMWAAISRAGMSVSPAGAKGTTRRIGRFGQSLADCAAAGAAPRAASSNPRRFSIACPLPRQFALLRPHAAHEAVADLRRVALGLGHGWLVI